MNAFVSQRKWKKMINTTLVRCPSPLWNISQNSPPAPGREFAQRRPNNWYAIVLEIFFVSASHLRSLWRSKFGAVLCNPLSYTTFILPFLLFAGHCQWSHWNCGDHQVSIQLLRSRTFFFLLSVMVLGLGSKVKVLVTTQCCLSWLGKATMCLACCCCSLCVKSYCAWVLFGYCSGLRCCVCMCMCYFNLFQ